MKSAFIGFPSSPNELVDNIEAGIQTFRASNSATQLFPWSELQGPSEPIIADVLEKIRSTEVSFFDISIPNANVFYEIGYAVGVGKAVYLLINSSIKEALNTQVDLGIFDTQRLKQYKNGRDLAQIFRDSSEPYKQARPGMNLDEKQPIFFQHHQQKIEFATGYFARLKKQNFGTRHHDPEEDHRLPIERAYREIASSAGVFLSLLPSTIKGSEEHNLRAYLLAGIADGSSVPKCVLKYQKFTAPFDLRDDVVQINRIEDIQDAIVAKLPFIHQKIQEQHLPNRQVAKSHLVNLQLGASSAENEVRTLDGYFVETREYHRTLRGEASLVVGRKGTGKTAIFWQVRNRMRANAANIVLDLRPEGFQLLKLNEIIEGNFTGATQAHTLTVFWEYVLYLELAHKILSSDQDLYHRDRRLEAPYAALKEAYDNVDEFREGDFPERLLRLINRLRLDLGSADTGSEGKILSTPEITELIYRTDFRNLRQLVVDYLQHKKHALILVDNLDRGWTTAGVSSEDVVSVQCLIDAGQRVQRFGSRNNADISAVIFLRDDVYDWLVQEASDRGKDSVVRISWNDVALMSELVDRRLKVYSQDNGISPSITWCDLSGDEPGELKLFNKLVDNSLRRPRSLIDLIELSLSNAALAGRSKIGEIDVENSIKSYSIEMLRDLNFEVRDIFPEADKLIYSFAKEGVRLDRRNAERLANRRLKNAANAKRFVDVMLWFGFFGILGDSNQEAYVFDHGDNLDLLAAHAGRPDNPILCVHPLFRTALSLRSDSLF
ncbi:MAG: hypothetical protein ABJH52_09735 [Henriciella sp.]